MSSISKVDLGTCSRELIHIPSAIQPHGALLVLDKTAWRILQASENAAGILGVVGDSVLGRSIGDIVGADLQKTIVQQIERLPPDRAARLALLRVSRRNAADLHLDIIGHHRDGIIVLEFEPAGRAEVDHHDLPAGMSDFLAEVEGGLSPDDLCRAAARQVRRLSGFDRVLIYRFDPQWHGVVVAEDRNDKLPSYLGHWFPATDIPEQARKLYQVNRSRIIPDAGYKPVLLTPPENPVTHLPLDMTFSVLRSVSPIHVEYMRNMGTAASMSFSIIRDGELWGLIACHNAAPLSAPYAVRRAGELIAQVFSLQLAAAERQSAIEQRVKLREYASKLLVSMSEADDFFEGLQRRPEELLAITDAAGAAIISRGQCKLLGQTPGEIDVLRIVAWLERDCPGQQVVRINDLPARYPEARRFANVASGLLATCISAATGSFVLWFRPEVIETVVWAGDPRKVPVPGKDGVFSDHLNPRKSFEGWTQIVRGTSSPWTDAQAAAVNELHADAIGIVLGKAEAMAALSAELQRANKELESFSYSVSHDLRAPFRHMLGYAELLRDGEAERLTERGRRYAGLIIDAARDAGRLIDNLLAFSQMGRAALRPVSIDLNILVREVRAEVMAAEGAGRTITWIVPNLPSIVADLAMLRLAVRNLLSNAVKYTRVRDKGARIEIRSSDTADETTLEVVDNGVGFDMKYVDKLFGVFQRLHRMEEYEGTGIGLANVRRTVERHNGRVWADGRVDVGARFGFSLPKQQLPVRI